MATNKYLRNAAIALALTCLLIITGTLGTAWHSHASGSDRACPVCHYSHQTADKPLSGHRLPVLATVGRSSDAALPALEPIPEFRRIPARAPPTA